MKKKTIIKAIIFDFMGVLLFERDNYVSDPIVEEIDNLIGQVTNDSLFMREAMKDYGLNEYEFEEILKKIVDKYERFQPLWDLLPGLRNKYKLAIINNGTALTLKGFHAKHPVKENFDLFASSAIEGMGKPDPEIYLSVARRLGVEPEECLFMDDTKIYTESAEKSGMNTIWWENKRSGFELFLEFLSENS